MKRVPICKGLDNPPVAWIDYIAATPGPTIYAEHYIAKLRSVAVVEDRAPSIAHVLSLTWLTVVFIKKASDPLCRNLTAIRIASYMAQQTLKMLPTSIVDM